jgi:predicted DNA-binding transcriptional regulator YafY
VEPHRLVPVGRRWYLVAFDLGRHDWRSFRLDRLSAPRATGARFRPRALPATDAAAFVRAGLESAPAASFTAVVRVAAAAPVVRARVGHWATVTDRGEQACELRMTTDNLDWPTMAVGSIGAEFEVVEPPELADHVRAVGQRFARATVSR